MSNNENEEKDEPTTKIADNLTRNRKQIDKNGNIIKEETEEA